MKSGSTPGCLFALRFTPPRPDRLYVHSPTRNTRGGAQPVCVGMGPADMLLYPRSPRAILHGKRCCRLGEQGPAVWPSGNGGPGKHLGHPCSLHEARAGLGTEESQPLPLCSPFPVLQPPSPLSRSKVISNPGLGILKVILSIKFSLSSVPRCLLGHGFFSF